MEFELVQQALQQYYPHTEGWRQLRAYTLDSIEIEMFFYRKGQHPVAVLVMDGVLINSDDVKLACHLQNIYKQKMNGRDVHVMLVYNQLLLRPQKIPSGISVMSITEEHPQQCKAIFLN